MIKRIASLLVLASIVLVCAAWVPEAQWATPSGTNTVEVWSGSSFAMQPYTGSLPTGTAGQALFTDGGVAAFATMSGDLSCSTVTPGNCSVANISGTSPIVVTPNELRWVSGATGPLLDQAALTSTSSTSGANGVNITVTAQAGQAATGASHNGGNGGNIVLTCGAGGTSGSASAGSPGYVSIANASGTLEQCGLLVGQSVDCGTTNTINAD